MDICSQNLVNFGRLFQRQFCSKILNSVKIFLTLFLYIVWLSAMKFGMVSGICAQQVTSYFGELWSTFVGAEIFDSEYLLYFLLRRNEIWQG